MAVMPELIMHTMNRSSTKTCIIGKSLTGTPVVTFENEEQARKWRKRSPNHRVAFFRQTITEEEVQIDI